MNRNIISIYFFFLFFIVFITNNFFFSNLDLNVDDYFLLGKNLVELKSFSREIFINEAVVLEPVIDRLPIYPAINAIGYLFFKSDNFIITINYLLFFISNIIFFKIALRFCNLKFSLIILMINCLSFVNLKNIVSINPAILCNFLLIFISFYAYKTIYNPKKSYILYITILIFISLLTRHDTVFFIIPFFFILYLFFSKKIFVYFISICLFVILIWSSINFYRSGYFGYSNLSYRAIYVNYVLFKKQNEEQIYKNFLNKNQTIHFKNLRGNEVSNYFDNLDSYYKKKITIFIVENPFNVIKTAIKSFSSMYIHSSHPNENIIISKIYKSYDYEPSKKQTSKKFESIDNILIKYMYYFLSIIFFIFGIFILISNILFLKKPKENISLNQKFLYTLNFSSFSFLLFSGLFGGLSYNDRGLALVYNFIILIVIYNLKCLFIKRK